MISRIRKNSSCEIHVNQWQLYSEQVQRIQVCFYNILRSSLVSLINYLFNRSSTYIQHTGKLHLCLINLTVTTRSKPPKSSDTKQTTSTLMQENDRKKSAFVTLCLKKNIILTAFVIANVSTFSQKSVRWWGGGRMRGGRHGRGMGSINPIFTTMTASIIRVWLPLLRGSWCQCFSKRLWHGSNWGIYSGGWSGIPGCSGCSQGSIFRWHPYSSHYQILRCLLRVIVVLNRRTWSWSRV